MELDAAQSAATMRPSGARTAADPSADDRSTEHQDGHPANVHLPLERGQGSAVAVPLVSSVTLGIQRDVSTCRRQARDDRL